MTNSDPSRDAPNTGMLNRLFVALHSDCSGVTRYYDLHVSRATLAPDGVELSMIVINDQYPGPLLEANWGDW